MIGVVEAIGSARGDQPPPGSRRTVDDACFAAAAVGMALLLIAIGIEHYWLRDLKFDDAWIHSPHKGPKLTESPLIGR